ncbi:MAG: RimK/LysX family protein [Fimbriimonadales bacterium]|nr:RimK/LysX family protein [Fimbriimonadales bacterium]
MKKRPEQELLSIGWVEYIDFPEWGLFGVKAKSDTGARTSVLDVTKWEDLGDGTVRFEAVLRRDTQNDTVTVIAPIKRRTHVKSSFGSGRDRITVEAKVRIGPVEKVIEVGLASRRKLTCRALLGRTALEGHFVVDPSQSYAFGRKRKRKVKSP